MADQPNPEQARNLFATRREIADAFVEWDRQFAENPDAFGAAESDPTGDNAADFLIELVDQARNNPSIQED